MPGHETPLRPAVFHILLALAGTALHGLGIAEAVAEATTGSVKLGPGTLYRSLKEMARDGLISEVQAPSESEDPRRRFYDITKRGRALVQAEAERLAWRAKPESCRARRSHAERQQSIGPWARRTALCRTSARVPEASPRAVRRSADGQVSAPPR